MKFVASLAMLSLGFSAHGMPSNPQNRFEQHEEMRLRQIDMQKEEALGLPYGTLTRKRHFQEEQVKIAQITLQNMQLGDQDIKAYCSFLNAILRDLEDAIQSAEPHRNYQGEDFDSFLYQLQQNPQAQSLVRKVGDDCIVMKWNAAKMYLKSIGESADDTEKIIKFVEATRLKNTVVGKVFIGIVGAGGVLTSIKVS